MHQLSVFAAVVQLLLRDELKAGKEVVEGGKKLHVSGRGGEDIRQFRCKTADKFRANKTDAKYIASEICKPNFFTDSVFAPRDILAFSSP